MNELIKIALMRGNLSPELGYLDIRVDRASVLGNPFIMIQEKDRDIVCDVYDEWLLSNEIDEAYWIKKWKHITTKSIPSNQQINKELDRHVTLLLQGNKLRYLCWCKKTTVEVRCHADSIKKEVLRRYKQEVNLKDNTFYDYYTSDSYVGKYR